MSIPEDAPTKGEPYSQSRVLTPAFNSFSSHPDILPPPPQGRQAQALLTFSSFLIKFDLTIVNFQIRHHVIPTMMACKRTPPGSPQATQRC